MTSVTTPVAGGPRPRRITAEPGIWLFVLLDMTVFGLFFGAAVHFRGEEPEVFSAGQDAVHVGWATLNTFFLVTASLLVVRAVEACRESRTAHARRLLLGAIAGGLGFMAVKGVEYATLISEGHTAHTSTYFQCYFAFTGVHLLHVVVATGLLAALWRALGRADVRPALVEGTGIYWHMVDLLWLILFPLLYLSS